MNIYGNLYNWHTAEPQWFYRAQVSNGVFPCGALCRSDVKNIISVMDCNGFNRKKWLNSNKIKYICDNEMWCNLMYIYN